MKISTEQWKQAADWFGELVELDGTDQNDRLEAMEADDPELAALVRQLLAEDQQAHPLLSQPLGSSLSGVPSREQDLQLVGSRMGNYRLSEMIGQGAMSSVFLAERADGEFEQRVALKLTQPDFLDEELRVLFKRERQLLASLQHPNIARLYDGGMSEDGRPFFTMEYVEGLPITEYCREKNLSFEQTLDIFAQLVRAVRYAHRRFVAHLDLKPSNILVNQEGMVKVLDFGIAQLQSPTMEADGEKTWPSKRYTLAYAAPEQVQAEQVSILSDIYTLGILLKEMLEGEHPFANLLQEPVQLRQAIAAGDIPPLKKQAGSPTPAMPTSALKAWELGEIIAQATAKQPEERYPSVEQLLQDVRAVQENQPVSVAARRPAYLLQKFWLRHQKAVIGAAVALVLLVGTVAFYTQALKKQRDAARREAAKSANVLDFLSGVFQMADPFEVNGDTVTAVQLLENGVESLNASLVEEPEVLATLQLEIGQIYLGLGKYEQTATLAHQAHAFFKQQPSPNPDLAECLHLLGDLHLALGTFDSARMYFEQSFGQYISLPKRDAEMEALVLEGLASVLYEEGDFVRADSVYGMVYQQVREIYDPPHAKIANMLHMLGTVKRKLGNYDEAEKLLQESLEMKETIFETPHHEIAYTLNHLASLEQDRGDYEAAIPYAKEALAQRQQIFGGAHVESVASQANLARIYSRLGHWEESAELYQGALSNLQTIFPDGHYYTAGILMSLGTVQLRQGNLEAAALQYQEAIALSKQLGMDGNPRQASMYFSLGRTRARQGRFQEAADLVEKALTMQTAALPEGNEAIAVSRVELGRCLLELNQPQTALPHLEAGYEVLKDFPEKHRDNLLEALQALVKLCEQAGQDEKLIRYQGLLGEMGG